MLRRRDDLHLSRGVLVLRGERILCAVKDNMVAI